MSYCGIQLIKNWHKLNWDAKNMIEVISETQKVGCTSFTSYKVGQKSNIKQKMWRKAIT